MQSSVQITFLNCPPSPALEEEIRARVEALEPLSARATSCRVFVEAPGHRHHKGTAFEVRIELHMPGQHLVAGRSPRALASHDDPRAAVHDAFHALRRQLESYLQRQNEKHRASL